MYAYTVLAAGCECENSIGNMPVVGMLAEMKAYSVVVMHTSCAV